MPHSQSLRSKISLPFPLHVMSAHSPLSAVLAEQAGFDGIWASGFELSALFGIADVSLVSMTQHLDMVRAMADRCSLPIVADIDTGFGNAINVIYAVQQYQRAGAAAVVIEDKTFPKVTSLVAGGRQDLARLEEMVGKVRAAVATRASREFLVIARTEALIAGAGQDEALNRAHAYEAAGADMILVHSKQRTPDEVEAFSRAWQGNVPLVIVPTAYPELDETRIKALGNIGMVIYGNHALRASVTAIEEIFALQQMDQIRRDEVAFLA